MAWNVFNKLKGAFVEKEQDDVELSDDYVELEADVEESSKSKVLVKPFTLGKFEDVRDILTAIRAGHIIGIINIAPLREKEITSLKRAIDKIKKTVEANEGDIAGFGDNFLVVTPNFARIYRKGKDETPERMTERPSIIMDEPTLE